MTSRETIDKYQWLRIESAQNEPVDAEEERAYTVELYSALEIAEAKLSKMEEALDDIAKGMASVPDDVLEAGKPAFTNFMWTYSQKRAREALAGDDEGKEDNGN